jgi:putative oxidoreductase
MTDFSDPVSAALLLLRGILGVVFLAHGIKHALGREKTTAWFASLGFKSPGMQWLTITVFEIGAGLLAIIGLLTGAAALAFVAMMFVAYWVNHRKAGFWITAFMKDGVEVEGYEYVLTLAVASIALAISGPGEFSLDWAIELDGVPLAALLDGWVGAILGVGGIAAGIGQLIVFWRPDES